MKGKSKRNGINKSDHKHDVSAVILVRPNGEMLLQLRDDGNGRKIAYPCYWCFPGGRKEKNEDYLRAASRELKEEYDLELRPEKLQLFETYFRKSGRRHVFLCRVSEDLNPKLREGAGFAWIKLSGLEKLKDLTPMTKLAIPKLKKYFQFHGR